MAENALATVDSSAFSKQMVAKKVNHEIMVHPATTSTFFAGVGGAVGLAMSLPSIGPIIALALCVGGFGGCAVTYIVNRYVRYNSIELAYMDLLHQKIQRQKEELLRTLHRDLDVYGCSIGANQIQKVKEKYNNLMEIIDRQLSRGEIAYSRYTGVAEQIHLGVLDQLNTAVLHLKSMSDIDVSSLQSEIATLQHECEINPENASSCQRLNALQERLTVWQSSNKKVEAILATNEQALTEMDKAQANLATLKTQRGDADLDVDEAAEEFEGLFNILKTVAAQQ